MQRPPAASRRTKAQLAAFRSACESAIGASNPADAALANLVFHQSIVEATANEHFISVRRFLRAQLNEGILFTRRLLAGTKMETDVHAEHRGIFEAIEAREPELAAQRSLEHILNSQLRLKLTLSQLA